MHELGVDMTKEKRFSFRLIAGRVSGTLSDRLDGESPPEPGASVFVKRFILIFSHYQVQVATVIQKLSYADDLFRENCSRRTFLITLKLSVEDVARKAWEMRV